MHAPIATDETEAAGLILIVEDDERSRKLVRDILQFHGYRTLEAVTGEEALELARNALPQLILMDIRLPGMDGEDALLRLRSDPATADIPVLAVTASVMRGDEQRLRRAGFDGYIPKPIDVVGLPSAVRRFFPQEPIQ
jgi:two-component system, cell cycle response regulator DivK